MPRQPPRVARRHADPEVPAAAESADEDESSTPPPPPMRHLDDPLSGTAAFDADALPALASTPPAEDISALTLLSVDTQAPSAASSGGDGGRVGGAATGESQPFDFEVTTTPCQHDDDDEEERRDFDEAANSPRGPVGRRMTASAADFAAMGRARTTEHADDAAAPRLASDAPSTGPGEECLVCQADHLPATVRLACCGAAAHIHCLTRWLRRSQNCPHCRGFLREPTLGDSSTASSSADVLDDDAMDELMDNDDAALRRLSDQPSAGGFGGGYDDEDDEGGMQVEYTREPATVATRGSQLRERRGGDEDALERNFRRFERRMRAPRASPRPAAPPAGMPGPASAIGSAAGSFGGPASGQTSPQHGPNGAPLGNDQPSQPPHERTPPRWVGGYRANMNGPTVSMEDLSLAGGDADDVVGSPFDSGSFARGPPSGVYAASAQPTPPGGTAYAAGHIPQPVALYAASSGSYSSFATPQHMPAVLRRDVSSGAFERGGGFSLQPQGSFSDALLNNRQLSQQSMQSEYTPGANNRQFSTTTVNDSFARDGAYRPNRYGPTPTPIE